MEHIIGLVFVLGAAGAGYRYPARLRAFLAWPVLHLAGLAAGFLAVCMYGFGLAIYIVNPDYVDHIQPQLVSIAWLVVHGRPVYPDWTRDDVYGTLYGPLTYFINGAFLLLGPGFFMSKLPGLAACFAAIGFFGRRLRAAGMGGYVLFFGFTLFIADMLPEDFYSYGLAADSFLLLLSVIALGAATAKPAAGAARAGLLAGLAAGFKAHAFLYIGPAVFRILAHARNRRHFARLTAVLGAALLATLLLVHCSFAMVTSYVLYLWVFTNHSLSFNLFMDNLWLVLSYAAAPLLAACWLRPRLGREDKAFIAGLGLAAAGIILLASKPGAGTHHMLPLVPSFVYLLVLLLKAPAAKKFVGRQRDGFMAFVLAMNLAFAGPAGVRWDWQQLDGHDKDFSTLKIDEMKKFLAAYPGAQIGVTDNFFYTGTYYRPLSVFNGGALHLDVATWMDLNYSGVPDDTVLWTIRGCHIPAWIMPPDEPFSILNPFTDAPLFSDRFRKTFQDNYVLAEHGEFYGVFVCK